MILSFHRSHQIAVNIAKPGAETRVFVFDVALGVRKETQGPSQLPLESQVDPHSGMLLNLTQMDQFLRELARMWEAHPWSSLRELVLKSEEFIADSVLRAGAGLWAVEEIRFTEKRGFWLQMRQRKLFGGAEEIRELGLKLFKIRSQYPLDENHWEERGFQNLNVSSLQDLFSGKVFLDNPGLDSLEIEDLATFEKWSHGKI